MTAPASPYKGLASFEDSELDELLFFGREREREIIAANLMASRLTVLYGETGVGKSSVLRAAVVRHLRALPEPLAVIVFDDWQDDPAAALRAQLAWAVSVDPADSLADTLELCAALTGGEVFVVLDGLEEYFLYHGAEGGADSFLDDFSEAVARPGLRASFLLSVREDALAKLDRFKGRIPNVLGNYLRLDHLDRSSAREAIVGPVDRYNELSADGSVEIEPALVEAVLDQVAAGKVELGRTGRGGVDEDVAGGRIEAPFLQLVMARLWESEQASGSRVIRLQTLVELGGAEQVVRDHLDGALAALSPEQQDLAASVFNHLVTPSGAKIAHDVADLAGYVGAAPPELTPVLASLAAQRILRPVPGVPGSELPRYEIYHDILADAVLAWRTRHEASRQLERVRESAARRHRRLLLVAAAAVLLAGAMAGVTIFAFTQRSEADAQARRAQARALDASALSELQIDPELSLALAVAAVNHDRTGQAEDVLRRALLASRERGIFRADGPVTAAHYEPDGSRLLVAGGAKARIYETASRRLLLTLNHRASITAADFSPTGRMIFTAGADGAVRLWSASTGRLLRVLRNGAPVRSVQFDSHGSGLLATGGRVVNFWRIADGRRMFRHHFAWPVIGARATSDATLVAVMGNHTSVPIYSVSSGKLLHRFVQGDFVKDIAFSPNDTLLVTGGRKGGALAWNVATGKLRRSFPHPGDVRAVAFSPDGRMLATASSDGVGRIWDVATGRLTAPLIGHTHFVVAIAFSSDGRYVVTSSTDGTARVWDVGGEFRTLLVGDSDAVTQASFGPDDRQVLTASDDGTARLWDPQIQPRLSTLVTETGSLLRASYVAPGLILTAGPGPEARLLRTADGRLVRSFRVARPVVAAAASRDGRVVAVAAGRTSTLFDRATGRRLRRLHQSSYVEAVALSPTGDRLATGDSDGRGRIWSLRGGRPPQLLHGHSGPITDIAFSPDGERVATASSDWTARIWDVRSGRTTQTLKRDSNGITSVDFSPDGRLLLTASKDADVRLWNVAAGEQEQLLRWHFGDVGDAVFSPDGRWIVSVGPITIQLWRPGVREPVFRLGVLGPGGMTAAAFDSSSHRIFAVARNGQVLTYRCTICGGLDELLSLARARLATTGRQLTDADRKRFGG